MAPTPAERKLRAQVAAQRRWAKTSPEQRRSSMDGARQAWLDRLADEADPDHEWPEHERQRAARQLMSAHMKAIALKSVRARRRAREATAQAERADAELAAMTDELDDEP